MQVYFEYLLKVSICQAITFFFYSLLLKRITWYAWNRHFLVTFSVLAFLIPFVDAHLFSQVQQPDAISFINQIPSITAGKIIEVSPANKIGFDFYRILSIAYLLAFSILLLRLFIQLLSIKNIKSKARLLT